MRRVSYFAIFSGIIFLATSIAAPSIIRWQMHNALAQFNALDRLDLLVAITLQKIGPSIIETGIHSVLAILAGMLIYRRRKAGYRLLLALSVWAVLSIPLQLAMGGRPTFLSTTLAAWWLFVLISAVRRNARLGEVWWMAASK